MKFDLLLYLLRDFRYILFAFLLQICGGQSTAQSNYLQHGDSGNYSTIGLPKETTLDGKVTQLDDISPLIFLNRTKAALNCAAGSMQVDLKFNDHFHGIIQADYDRSSACRVSGKGAQSYRLELPLKGCGTVQNPTRVFTNNIIVRFHASLEMDGDEIITIVCRYPPPVSSLPPAPPSPILNPIATSTVLQPPLKSIQILMIICAIMFLTLLLLGLAVSYYCLRSQAIPVVRRLPISLGSGSEITKLSGSSIGNITMFEGVKIPRAHAALQVMYSSSGSEGVLIPSDYPSESHSEIEEIDTRSLPFSSAGSFENRAFAQETSSIYSDHFANTQELPATNEIKTRIIPNSSSDVEVNALSPKFDIQVRVKKSPLPCVSPVTSDTESLCTTRHDRNNLSTIMEAYEDRESVMTSCSIPSNMKAIESQFTYIPELHMAPYASQPQSLPLSSEPQFSVYTRTHHKLIQGCPETWSDYTDEPGISEIADSCSEPIVSRVNDKSQPNEAMYYFGDECVPVKSMVLSKQQPVTLHTVDDVYLRTVTEKKTIEDIESHKRLVTEYETKPIETLPNSASHLVDPKFNVKMRKYSNESEQQKWESFSDISSISGISLTPKQECFDLISSSVSSPTHIYDNKLKLTSPELVGNMKPIEIPPFDKDVPNWDVLIRILEEPDLSNIVNDSSSVYSISYDDKAKWKEIITTESLLRTMLTEAVVREDFERIRSRYDRMFEPQAWDVIIRILAPSKEEITDVDMRLPKRSKRMVPQPWDTRSRRSSLPTLYEYDSDGGSSVRTIRNESVTPQTVDMISPGSFVSQCSRRSSHTSYQTDQNDLRSMSELTVNYGRAKVDHLDNESDDSSYCYMKYYVEEEQPSIQRSISHPSLARSASEFTEHWTAPEGVHGIDLEGKIATQRVAQKSKFVQNHPAKNTETQ